ncbi:MAG: DUF4097 domain-containing protein [Chloroflexi bacterium]|nr:DUF4097 domain-containing protein [Chloroflexota bacterium]MBU1879368.1 DUF4097 domain-containing protein [Chloroflexota bacterium]
MDKQAYPLSAGVALILSSCQGQISLAGAEQTDLTLKGIQAPEMQEMEGRLEMGPLQGTGKMVVPRQTPVTIRDASGELTVKRLAGDVTIEAAHGDLSLRYLEGTTTVQQAHGQTEARELKALRLTGTSHGSVYLRRIGDLDVQEVNGDMSISRVEQAARIVQVNGDLRVSEVDGPLTIDEVDGDLRVRQVAGRLFVNLVSGDLSASGLTGGASVEEVAGDINASIDPKPGQEYRLRAHGDIALRISPTAYIRLEAVAPAGKIRSDLTLTVEEEEAHRLVGVLAPRAPEEAAEDAPGPATVVLVSAQGDIRLRPVLSWDQELGQWGEQFGRDMGQWGEQFGREMGQWGEQFGQEMGRMGQDIGQEIAAAFQGVDTERVTERATETAARVQVKLEQRLSEIDVDDLARKAEAAATAGIARAQEAVNRALSRLEQEGILKRDAASRSTESVSNAVPNEEKLAILKMIETGRITAAEGEMLLDALEN